MQYTAIFHGCKNVNFQMIFLNIFLIFAQNIDCGYSSNEYPCKPQFYYIKVGCKGYTLYGLISMIENDNNVKHVLLRDILEHDSYSKRFQNDLNDFNQLLETM